jgi:outer membrane protein OmpA-like peptidoglycan-associated protein
MKRLLLGICALGCLAAASPGHANIGFILFFDSNSDRLNANGRFVVENAAACFKQDRLTRLRLIGSADRAGGARYNLALSHRRADAVKAELVRLGLPAAILETAGMGETRPLTETADGVANHENRYVWFEVLGLEDVAREPGWRTCW